MVDEPNNAMSLRTELAAERAVPPERIEAMCLEIQAGWTPEEERSRRRPATIGGVPFVGARLDGDLRGTCSDVPRPRRDRSGLRVEKQNQFDNVARSYEDMYE